MKVLIQPIAPTKTITGEAPQSIIGDSVHRFYLDPNLGIKFEPRPIRESTIKALEFYRFEDDDGKPIVWTHGQLEIIDCIINRSSPEGLKRIEIVASTQYGKSLAVAAGIVIRASLHPEKWAIVAGTTEKARIIMEYVIILALNNDIIRTQLTADTPLDRLRMKKSAERLTFKRRGEVRVYSAEANKVMETSKSLMGQGAQNVVQDESALVGDTLQATILRMLGGHADNFLVKIGNPFNRGHFFKTWSNGKYHRIFIDYHRAVDEGRYTQEFIDEMKQEAMFDVLYECKFPEADAQDRKGWSFLLTEDEVRRAFVKAEQPFGYFRLGCDVAGGGQNYSTIVLRSYNVATLLYKRNEKDTMKFTGEIINTMRNLAILPQDVAIDKVGIGRGVYDRMSEQKLNDNEDSVVGVNAGEPANDFRFFNKRAEMYWRIREWLLKGGKLEASDEWLELTKIKYKVDSSGKIKLMSKEEMLAEQVESPDVADALSLTFYAGEPLPGYSRRQSQTEVTQEELDPYARH